MPEVSKTLLWLTALLAFFLIIIAIVANMLKRGGG